MCEYVHGQGGHTHIHLVADGALLCVRRVKGSMRLAMPKKQKIAQSLLKKHCIATKFSLC